MYQNTQPLLSALQRIAAMQATDAAAGTLAEKTLFEFNDNLAQQIRQNLSAVGSQKVQAIVLYRQHIGGSLSEAKTWVENHMAKDV